MRITWDMLLGGNIVWTGLCILLVTAAVYWSTAHALRTAWHRSNAEAMATAVEETTATEMLCDQMASLEGDILRLRDQVAATRGDRCDRREH